MNNVVIVVVTGGPEATRSSAKYAFTLPCLYRLHTHVLPLEIVVLPLTIIVFIWDDYILLACPAAWPVPEPDL